MVSHGITQINPNGCSQEALRSSGGDGLFYCFAVTELAIPLPQARQILGAQRLPLDAFAECTSTYTRLAGDFDLLQNIHEGQLR